MTRPHSVTASMLVLESSSRSRELRRRKKGAREGGGEGGREGMFFGGVEEC